MHSGDRINGSCFDAWDREELERQQGLRCKSRNPGRENRQGGRKPRLFYTSLTCPWLHGPKEEWALSWVTVFE